MIDVLIRELIREFNNASDAERAAFHKKVAKAGMSAGELIEGVNNLAEIARNTNGTDYE